MLKFKKSSNSENNEEIKITKKENIFKRLSKSRKARKGAISIALTLIFIVAIIGVNVIMNLLVDRFPSMSLDLTKNGAYNLQNDTIEYLKDIEDEVTINILASESDFEANGEYFVQANNLLKRMPEQNPNIKLNYVDLTSNPTFTTNYTNIDWTSSQYLLLIESGDDYRALSSEDLFDFDQQSAYYYGSQVINGQHVEQAVVTAILNVTTKEKVKVSVLSGHDENDSTALTTLLENNAFETETISLLTDDISEDSKFLIIFAPSVDITNEELETINDWLYNDGNYNHNLLYVPNDQVQDNLENFNSLLSDWGMETKKGIIFETDTAHMTNTSSPYFVTIMDYENNDYTEGLKTTKIPVVMLYTMPIEITDKNMATSLLTSSDKAVLMPFSADENWDYNDEVQEKFNGAVLSTKTEDENSSNLLVFGSYDALGEAALSSSSFNNSSYILNIFNKLADRDDIGVTIEGKALESNELGITSSGVSTVVLIIVVIIIPLIVIAVCVIVLIRRRTRI